MLAHHDHSIRKRRNFLQHGTLVRIGLAQHRVQGSSDRHSQPPQDLQNMSAGSPPKNPVFVL